MPVGVNRRPHPSRRCDVAYLPIATKIHVRWYVSGQGKRGLVMLNVIFVARDPTGPRAPDQPVHKRSSSASAQSAEICQAKVSTRGISKADRRCDWKHAKHKSDLESVNGPISALAPGR